MKMRYSEDLDQQLALLLNTPEFIKEIEEFHSKQMSVDEEIAETKTLMKRHHIPGFAFETFLHYLNHNELLIPTGYGFRYEKDPVTGEWMENMELAPDFPTGYAQQAVSELNKRKLIPFKRKKRKSTYFDENLKIYQLAQEAVPTEKIEKELKANHKSTERDEWAIRQAAYRQRKRLKHNA